eukprot:scaffold14290_cov125-Isochrysis_galbana.AAC.18
MTGHVQRCDPVRGLARRLSPSREQTSHHRNVPAKGRGVQRRHSSIARFINGCSRRKQNLHHRFMPLARRYVEWRAVIVIALVDRG